jgi:type IV secretory pathway TraG/TraD family ATPase VirD4
MSDTTSGAKPNNGVFGRAPKLLILVGLSGYAISEFGPVFHGAAFESDPNWPSFIAASIASAAGMALVSDTFKWLAGHLELQASRTPEGHKGKARFAELCEIEQELNQDGVGPYWGSIDGRAITSDFGSNALVIGPPGSNKSVGVIVPTIWSIQGSKVVMDFKSELACVMAKALRDRGENVVVLNIADINADILGLSATYNPPNLIADNFFRAGGLRDVSNDISEFSHQICPEPAGGGGENRFFDLGARDLAAYGLLVSILIDGHGATLGDVTSLLNNKARLLDHALWGCGRLPDEYSESGFLQMDFDQSPWFDLHSEADQSDFIGYFRDLSTQVSDLLSQTDTKSGDSFLTGARQNLERFNRSTRAFNVTRSSSFRFSDLKSESAPTTVFIIADPARMKAQEKVLSLIQFCMYSEFLRDPNTQNKVHVISDETSNFKIDGLV